MKKRNGDKAKEVATDDLGRVAGGMIWYPWDRESENVYYGTPWGQELHLTGDYSYSDAQNYVDWMSDNWWF